MTLERASHTVALVFIFVGGLLIGAFVAAARPAGPELHELSGEMLNEANEAFKDYEANMIRKHVSVALFDGCKLNVAIIREFREVGYGYAEVADLPRQFWVSRHGVSIYRYDNHHLFFALSDWYIAEVERMQAEQVRGTK
jgi:hypothetical protein